jgi:O-antigen/teichoic acid export membrane protein
VTSEVTIAAESERFSSENARSPSKEIVGQSVYVFGAQVLGLSCAIVSNFLIAKMLGPEGKGLIYLLQLMATTGPALLSFGLGPAAVYYLGRERLYPEREVRTGVLSASFSLGALPLAVAILAWPLIGGFAGRKLGPFYLFLGLGMVPFAVVAWNVSYLSLAQGRILAYNLLRSAQNLWFLLGLFLLFCFYGGNLRGAALCWAVSVFALGAAAPFVSRVRDQGPARPVPGFLKSAFRFGWRSHLGAVTQFLQQRVDVLLVSLLCTLRDVGFYSLAVAAAEVLWYVPQTVANVLMPHVANSSEERASRLTATFCRTVFAINAFLSVVLALVGAWIVPLMLPAFRSSVEVIWLLLPGTVAASVSRVLASDLNGRGQPMETFGPPALTLGVCALVGIAVIPRFGITGAAVVTSCGHILNSALFVRVYTRITGVPASELLLMRYSDVSKVRSYLAGLATRSTQ